MPALSLAPRTCGAGSKKKLSGDSLAPGKENGSESELKGRKWVGGGQLDKDPSWERGLWGLGKQSWAPQGSWAL